MDEIMRRASKYFKEFEGRHLYPKFFSWQWFLWLVTAVIFAICTYRGMFGARHVYFADSRVLMFGSEFVFLGACALIGRFKTLKSLAGAPAERGKRGPYLDARKTAKLEEICGVDSSKFAALAKECCDLMAVKKQFRVVSDASLGDVMRNLYDPDSKARILALVLSAAALFAALLNHSIPAEEFNILDSFADEGFKHLFTFVMSLAVVGFGVYIGVRVLVGWLVELLRSGWTVFWSVSSGSTMALNYFIRDLIRLHVPARTQEPMTTK